MKKLKRINGMHAGITGTIHPGLRGDISGLRGNIHPDLRGNISGLRGNIHPDLRGNISDLSGDCIGITGNLDLISIEERKANPNIEYYAEAESE